MSKIRTVPAKDAPPKRAYSFRGSKYDGLIEVLGAAKRLEAVLYQLEKEVPARKQHNRVAMAINSAIKRGRLVLPNGRKVSVTTGNKQLVIVIN